MITSNGGGGDGGGQRGREHDGGDHGHGQGRRRGATLTYTHRRRGGRSLFTINATTGALAFVAAPNFESPADVGGDNVYDVTVQACDGS